MTRIVTQLTLAATIAATLSACEAPNGADTVPLLSDLDTERSAVGLVDREAAIADAVDFDLATRGDLLALDAAGDGFRMSFDGEGVVRTDGAGTERDAMPTYQNVWAGVAAVTAAERVRHAVVTPAAIAIAVAANGTITQIAPNAWLAENTLDLPEGPLTVHFTVAWVQSGYLAEMRVTTADKDHALWFDGYVSDNHAIGWWDLYDGADKAAVVEWIADGDGHGQFGIAAVSGEHAGAWLQYAFTEDFDRIDAYDPASDEHAWVQVWPDDAGEVRLPDFNAGEPACWGTDLRDTACPE